MEDKIIEVINLKKHFSAHKAVDDISFSIPKGKIFGLLGPNGAGKSTLLRMITGINYPDEGQVLFDGKAFDTRIHHQRLGYMPEERGLYKKMKTGEQIIYLAQLKGLNKQEAVDATQYWFDRLGMHSWWDKKVEDLSKGMSQKLQFVSTVVHNPDLLILDEPFSGLDPVNASILKDEIFRLAEEEGKTIIFSTHRMEQVEEICDTIVLINLGKKILGGEVDAIKQNFKKHLFEISFDKTLQDLPANIFIIEKKENSLIYKLEENQNPNNILKFWIDKDYTILNYQEILPSLNEIFIELVQGTDSVARAFV
ncbi:MAG TPA: ATP-binding cassette domain-containing protein [Chitinophagaceae bacterium]|nr:ATP-binding cassette domain-containing protein [Chitinophagaceae bacterium]